MGWCGVQESGVVNISFPPWLHGLPAALGCRDRVLVDSAAAAAQSTPCFGSQPPNPPKTFLEAA